MKYLMAILIIGLVGCAPKLPPKSQHIHNTDTLVNAIGTLGNAAIGANNQDLLIPSDTRKIVTFARDSILIIKNAKDGRKVAVLSELDRLQKETTYLNQFKALVDLIREILADLMKEDWKEWVIS